MKSAKKINAIALVAAILISGSAIATAAVLSKHKAVDTVIAQKQPISHIESPMQTVVITGKRLSASEKAAMD